LTLDFHPHSSQISRRRFSMEGVPPVRANAPARSLSRGTGPAPVTGGNGYVGRELFTCMFLANHTPNKGLPTLLRVFAGLHVQYVLIVGENAGRTSTI
jgi:hypothetical protein